MDMIKEMIRKLRSLSLKMTIPQSPVLLLVIVTSTIFVSETIVMFIIPSLPVRSLPVVALIDSILLIVLLFPVLYFFIFRQSKAQIAELLKAKEQLQTQIIDRKKAEEALRESERRLRYLSSQLLTAQEQERRRISMELHDELGQALSLLKLRLSYIGKKLKSDQRMIRDEFENILEYIDQVIENVRRLSRDLSPSILIDLGLTATLRRLVDEFIKHHNNTKFTSEIEDIDYLLSQKAQIFLYRIFQEAFTNIGKYAQAKNVSVEVKKNNGMIYFLIEDDGRGFDLTQFVFRNGDEKGLGLATMSERVWMLGGYFDLWSEHEKGTKISFSIPIESGES